MQSLDHVSLLGWIVGLFLVSLLGGGVSIELFMRQLRKRSEVLSPQMKKKKDMYLVRWLGLFERGLYTFCIILNQPAGIVAWLAVKVLTRWANQQDQTAAPETISLANIYLIGNLVTVIFGVVGGIICINL